MNLYSFALNIAATVIGGVILSLLFFWVKEKVFPIPRITGRWFFEMKTTETSYNPYKDMILQYEAIVSIEGKKIEGTVEKIYEDSSRTREKEYTGKHRTRGLVSGYVEKNYLGKDFVYLYFVEKNKAEKIEDERESTTFFKLINPKDNQMDGTFISTIARSKGIVKWQRGPFQK